MNNGYIFKDLNVRDEFVTDSKSVMIYDSKVIVQSIWRLINTEEGEIPNFRNYGLNIKQFMQYPLTEETVSSIYNYVKGKIEAFEDRAEVIKADVDVSFEQGYIYMIFFLRMKATGDVVKLPLFSIKVATA